MASQTTDTGTDIITVDHLKKTFGELTAVNDVSFSVRRGEIFAFLGPNGAGKTTTIKMLTTLLRPTSGSIRLNGHDPLHDQDAVRKSFGIVFQDPSLDDELTAWENLELHGVLYSVPKALRRERMEQLLEIVGLSDRKNDITRHFSGGMKRRLEIARGLLHHPKVLFLDEPTIGLDPQTRNHLWNYVGELNRKEGITVFLTTHYMEEADKVATRIAVIDHGKIVGQGSSQELKTQTNTQSLEDAFLALTGNAIREEEASSADGMRQMAQMWRGKRR
ncbi:MAG: ATP-binding cassette domain-containing protein [Candidatus Peribacteraceae bacterium]|nr:ATP-binding cassette domain-containing protein [Candidatus Peribacteraceae bacterium]